MNFAFEAAPESCDCQNVKKPKKKRPADVNQRAYSVMQDVIALSNKPAPKLKPVKKCPGR